MKVIIAGSRGIKSFVLVELAVRRSRFHLTEVFCGGAAGVDVLGAVLAERLKVPVRWFMPDWGRYGRAAGPIRNQAMVDEADALVAIWDGKSSGTADVVAKAKRKGIPIVLVQPRSKTLEEQNLEMSFYGCNEAELRRFPGRERS